MISEDPDSAVSRFGIKPLEQLVAEVSADATNDLRLASQVLSRDRKAIAEFVSRYADCVYSFVRCRVLPEAEAVEDLVQEIFLAAWQGLEKFRGESGIRHWLLGIARHRIEDYYRKRLREPSALDEDDEALPELSVNCAYDADLDRASAQEKTYRVLAKLPETYRLILLWRYVEECSTRQIAQRTEKTEKAIERLLARARDHFRREWNGTG
ncbi:MAG: sigma-70 family RNA polymerase sigma factor [Steroidobacteraceae bacterium]